MIRLQVINRNGMRYQALLFTVNALLKYLVSIGPVRHALWGEFSIGNKYPPFFPFHRISLFFSFLAAKIKIMPYKRVQSKSLTASTTSQDKRDAKRWLIIGAYQAGATEKQIARMCGINQPSVRRTILNFKKTGSPTLPRGLTPKGTSNMVFRVTNSSTCSNQCIEKSKPFLEYDGDGNLIDSDDENTDIVVKYNSSSVSSPVFQLILIHV